MRGFRNPQSPSSTQSTLKTPVCKGFEHIGHCIERMGIPFEPPGKTFPMLIPLLLLAGLLCFWLFFKSIEFFDKI